MRIIEEEAEREDEETEEGEEEEEAQETLNFSLMSKNITKRRNIWRDILTATTKSNSGMKLSTKKCYEIQGKEEDKKQQKKLLQTFLRLLFPPFSHLSRSLLRKQFEKNRKFFIFFGCHEHARIVTHTESKKKKKNKGKMKEKRFSLLFYYLL